MVFHENANPTGGKRRPGHRLDGHHRLFGFLDDAHFPIHLNSHQEANRVVDLDVRLDICARLVSNRNRLGHMGGQAGDHPSFTDHVRIFVYVADDAVHPVD